MSDRPWTMRPCGDAPRRRKGAAGGAACLALLLCAPAPVGAEEGQDETGGAQEADDPRHQLSLRTYVDLPGRTEVDAMFRFVGELPNPRVPRYAELDIHLGLRPRPSIELSIVGNDLLHTQHVEFGSLSPAEAFPRSVYARASRRF